MCVGGGGKQLILKATKIDKPLCKSVHRQVFKMMMSGNYQTLLMRKAMRVMWGVIET